MMTRFDPRKKYAPLLINRDYLIQIHLGKHISCLELTKRKGATW